MRNRFPKLLFLIFVASPGCMHTNPPYGYYNGYYGAGPSVLPPGQWGAPPLTQPLNQPMSQPYYQPNAPLFQPGGSNPTPIDGTTTPGTNNPSNWQTPQTYDPNNSAPFDANAPKGNVPDPADDNRPGASLDPLKPTSTSSNQRATNDYSLSDRDKGQREPRTFETDTAAGSEENFEYPIQPASGKDNGDVRQANRTTLPTDSSRPYGHDSKFQWIKGIVEYDEKSKFWVIMYDDNPPSADELGGELPLADHPSLDDLRSGDAVRIEGTFDATETLDDKPLYRIKRLKKQ